jgi:YtkA-like
MKFILVLALSLLSSLSFSAIHHEGTCSQVTKVCAVYHAEDTFTTTQEARFKLLLESSDQKEVTLIKADLWMQMGNHGHGSSPLKITPVAPGEFDVTKAYFVMRGTWQIRVTYEQESKQETLIIPVTVKQ